MNQRSNINKTHNHTTTAQPKVAIVHDFFFQFGGAESVINHLLALYPDADIYTSICLPHKFTQSPLIQKAWSDKRFKTTFLQPIFIHNFAYKYIKNASILHQLAMNTHVIDGYDTVIMTSTFCAKNIRLGHNKQVLHYCHTPTRYLYELVNVEDIKGVSPLSKLLSKIVIPIMRLLDQRAVRYLNSKQVIWAGNSKNIQARITKYYNTDSVLLYPGVEIERFEHIQKSFESHSPYIYFGRISPHKKVDLIVEACLQLRRPLIIAGTSPVQSDIDHINSIISRYEHDSPETKDLVLFDNRRVPDEDLFGYIARAKALIYPPEEDFGIAPIEALATGTPVIAFNKGGALEYVHDQINGVFFETQTVEGIIEGIIEFESITNWHERTHNIKQSAHYFSVAHFQHNLNNILSKT